MNRYTKEIHILSWLFLYIFWVLAFQKRAFSFSQTATVQFCYLIFIAANFYLNTFYTIPKYLYEKKYLVFCLFFFGGVIITALLRVPVAQYLNKYYFLPGKPQPGEIEIFYASILNIFIWVTCILSGKVIIDRLRFQQYLDDLKKEKSKAELNFLNAQFNPHFLFNSINSIYGHINKQNVVARDMLLTFSEMLRYQLYECNCNYITVDKEIEYLNNYITMQKVRKEENLRVEFYVADNVKGFQIVPLLLIVFIENAFKYVSNADDRINEVIISFEKLDNLLFFKCMNTTDASVNSTIHNTGIGIVNAKRRLELLYPDNHELTILKDINRFEIQLKLKVL